MNKTNLFLRPMVLGLALFFGSATYGAARPNVDSSGLALEGYDPISYFESKGPLKGSEAIKAEFEGATFRFVSESNKQKFLASPQKYQPQYGGWCAYAVAAKKEKVEVDPESYLIQDGRLLLFYKDFFNDTRKTWTTSKNKTQNDFLKEADSNWPEIK